MARRQYLFVTGRAAQATIGRIEAAPRRGMMSYRVELFFTTAAGEAPATAFVGEGIRGTLRRGDRVAVLYDASAPKHVVLEDDFGFARMRIAQLMLAVGVLVVGGYAVLFRLA